MPETPAQRKAKGLYTKAELKKLKGEEAHRVRNKVITKIAQSNQIPGSMYKGKGSDIPITVSAPSAPKRSKAKKLEGISKGITKPSSASISGAKIESSPITTRKTAGKNTGRLAQKASKLRSKGEAALESGNLAKSKRLRRRYDRQTSRLNKSMSNTSSGYSMNPGSKQKNTPTTFSEAQHKIINDLGQNFKTDI